MAPALFAVPGAFTILANITLQMVMKWMSEKNTYHNN
jgi:hypothetical protein